MKNQESKDFDGMNSVQLSFLVSYIVMVENTIARKAQKTFKTIQRR